MQVTYHQFEWKMLNLTEMVQIDHFFQVQMVNLIDYKFRV